MEAGWGKTFREDVEVVRAVRGMQELQGRSHVKRGNPGCRTEAEERLSSKSDKKQNR